MTRFRPGSSRPRSCRNVSRSASSSWLSSSSMAAETGTTSAPSPTARARTASRCGLFSKPSSRTLATYMTGLRVSRNRSRTCALSSSDRPSARAGLPASSPVRTRPRTSARALASLSPVLAERSARLSAFSTESRSASASSVSMVSMSEIGSTLPVTWTMSPCSKQRTTWVIASTSRMWARNLLPRPSPLAAPATRPAMSTNSTAVGMTFCGFTMSDSALRRGSGTGTTPTFGSIVQKGKFAAAMPALVSALNRVDLPTFGRPTMPHLMPMGIRGPCWLRLRRIEALHRLVEIARDRQRQDRRGVVDGAEDGGLVVAAGLAKHPRRDLVLVARMADADPQPMEFAVPEQAHGVAQAVLATVPAVELEPRDTGREIQFVVHEQRLFRLDLPVSQRGGDRFAAEVHEGRRLEHPHRLPGDLDLGGFAEQLRFQPEAHAQSVGKRVHKPEPGVVPGPEVFVAGISQPDDEAQASHAGAPRRAGRSRREREGLLLLFVLLGDLRRRHFRRDRRFHRLFDLFAAMLGDDDRDVVFLAELQLGDLDARRQLDVRQVDDVADRQVRQVDFDELRQILRQAAHFDFVELVRHDDVSGLAGRRLLFVEEVQRHGDADRLVLVHALEVQMHDDLLVRMALHVTQQDLLHLAVEFEVEDRRVEPLVLAGEPGLLVFELDALRGGGAAVEDGRDVRSATEAAARTLAFVLAAGGRDLVFGSHVHLLTLLTMKPPRGGGFRSPATR